MKIFIKLVLLVVIVGFALINYRYFSFDKGFSKTSMEDKSVTEVLKTVTGIKKVQYYKKPFASAPKNNTGSQRPSNYQSYDYIYRVYIVTSEDSYLLSATQDDIDAFSVLGVFSNNFKPEKIKPIPFYVEIIVGLIVLIVPFGKKKHKNSTQSET